jgi:predicted RNA-binding protein with PIN domain
VDGYSLLHNWPELAPDKPRHSAAARQELVHVLTRYHDATGTPITVVFDGSRPARERESASASVAVEILFSRSGQTADQIIERAAHRLKDYGEVLVVTDDFAERDTVINFGAMASSCDNFIRTVHGALNDLEQDIKHYNRQERARYRGH